MYATLPRAIQHHSETSWPSSTESALVGVLRTLAHQTFDQCHTTSDRMILASSTAQHVFNGRFRTYTANLQWPTISEYLSLLLAAWSSVLIPPPLRGITTHHNTTRVLWNYLQSQHWSSRAYKMQMLGPAARFTLPSGHILCSEKLPAE